MLAEPRRFSSSPRKYFHLQKPPYETSDFRCFQHASRLRQLASPLSQQHFQKPQERREHKQSWGNVYKRAVHHAPAFHRIGHALYFSFSCTCVLYEKPHKIFFLRYASVFLTIAHIQPGEVRAACTSPACLGYRKPDVSPVRGPEGNARGVSAKFIQK